MKRALLVVVALLFAAAGAWFGMHRDQAAASSARNDASAVFYGSTLRDMNGNPAALAQWKGKPLVVNFWATWCDPCVEEMPELSALQAQVRSRNIQILGIGVDTATNIAAFADKYHIAYPVYVAGMEGGELSRRMGNRAGGLPYTVLIGADGVVKKTWLGRLKMNELRRELDSM